MDYPNFIESNQKGESISLQMVKVEYGTAHEIMV